MDARGSSHEIYVFARCVILLACGGCGGPTLKDLAHKQLEASSAPDVHIQGNAITAFNVAIGYEDKECFSLTSAHATVNGVALRSFPGGVTYYTDDGHPGGCSVPYFALPTGDPLAPNPDGRYTVLVSDSSMQLSAEFGDFLAPATATLRSPVERIAHPQDQVVVDFAPPPTVYNRPWLSQVNAGFMLDSTSLAGYVDVQLTGSSASFRVPANVLGQGHLMTWWFIEVPTLRCEGVEGCTGGSFRQADLGSFEIRN